MIGSTENTSSGHDKNIPLEQELSALGIELVMVTDIAKVLLDRVKNRVEYEEKAAQEATTFREKLSVILELFAPSPYRDKIIEEATQDVYTSWDDLVFARQQLSTHTDEHSELEEKIRGVNQILGVVPVLYYTFLHSLDNDTSFTDALSFCVKALEIDLSVQQLHEVAKTVEEQTDFLLLLDGISEEEVLATLQDFLLNEHGFMRDTLFDKYGHDMISMLLDFVDKKAENAFVSVKKEVVVQALFLGLRELSAERRTAVLFTILKSIGKHHTSELFWQYIIVDIMQQFVAGTKLLQMDALLPEDVRSLAKGSKEEMPPTSKFYVYDVLKADNRLSHYQGIGPNSGSASTATVHPLRSPEDKDGEYKTVVKTINGDAKAHVAEELDAFKVVIKYMVAEMDIHLNVDAIISEISKLLTQELDPFIEAANTKILAQFRKRNATNGVTVPEVKHRSEKHLEMSMALGVSLRAVLENKASEEYRDMDIQAVFFKIVKDFFTQVFDYGIFNADEHVANIFVALPSRTASVRPQFALRKQDETLVTVIDHGEVGLVDTFDQKKVLFLFGLGFEMQEPKLIAQAMYQGMSVFPGTADEASKQNRDDDGQTMTVEVIAKNLVEMPGTMVENAIEIITKSGKASELILFAKGLGQLFPLLEKMNMVEKMRIALPYIRKFNLEKVLIAHSKALSLTVLRQTFLGKRLDN